MFSFFIKMANVAVFLIVFYTYNFFLFYKEEEILNLLILAFIASSYI